MPDYWPSEIRKTCASCGSAESRYMCVPGPEDEEKRFKPYPACAECAGEEPEEQITLVETYHGDRASENCVCTYVEDEDDDYCGDTAGVFVLVDNQWHYDCLCHEHLETMWTPEQNLHYYIIFAKKKEQKRRGKARS